MPRSRDELPRSAPRPAAGFRAAWLAAALLGAALAASCSAPPPAPQAAAARGAEATHPWAGRYAWGESSASDGAELLLDPREGVELYVRRSGVLHAAPPGRVIGWREGWLSLAFERAPPIAPLASEGCVPGASGRWLLFVWNGRRFVVPESRLPEFCNRVNRLRRGPDGALPLGGAVALPFLSQGPRGEFRPPRPPPLPAPYDAWIREEPLEGRVVEIVEVVERGEGAGGSVLARVDLGAADGLLVGMELVGRGERGFSIGAAEEVGEQDALVRFPVTDPPTPDRHPPLDGARVGTYDPLHPSVQGR